MTDRTRWLAVLSLAGIVAGAVRGQPTLALLSLTVFLGIVVEWIRFQGSVRLGLPKLRFERAVNGLRESRGTLWAERIVHIELSVSSHSPIAAQVRIHDVVPELLELHPLPTWSNPNATLPASRIGLLGRRLWQQLTYSFGASASLPNNQLILSPLSAAHQLRYQVKTRAAGVLSLPGVRLTLTDACGLFQLHRFIPLKQTFRVLPDYFQSADMRPTIKRHNTLAKHGVHRHQRAGLSSELLELREYVAGDPPKSIAWKASARRDKLMTRQYESEVPVRVQLFIDGSIPARIGGFGKRLLDQSTYVAASICKAAIGVGDPVAGILIDERGAQRLPWAAGDLGFLQILRSMADFADRPCPLAARLTPSLLQCANALCYERYPELLDRRYNLIPPSLFAARREKLRLINVLGETFQLSPLELTQCYCDDVRLAHFLQRLLFEAGMPWMPPLLADGVESEVGPSRVIPLLIESLRNSIARARDNEVFVVLADPQSCNRQIEELLPVIRLALSKHHRVVFVCPIIEILESSQPATSPKSKDVFDLLVVAEQGRIRELKQNLKRELTRLGVSISFSGQRMAIQRVLAEIDMVRSGRARTQGARSR